MSGVQKIITYERHWIILPAVFQMTVFSTTTAKASSPDEADKHEQNFR